VDKAKEAFQIWLPVAGLEHSVVSLALHPREGGGGRNEEGREEGGEGRGRGEEGGG
jgi:hypothetical protein